MQFNRFNQGRRGDRSMWVRNLFLLLICATITFGNSLFAVAPPYSTLPQQRSLSIAAFLVDTYLNKEISYAGNSKDKLDKAKVIGILMKDNDYIFSLDNNKQVRVVFFEYNRVAPVNRQSNADRAVQQQQLQMQQAMSSSLAEILNENSDDQQSNPFQVAGQMNSAQTGDVPSNMPDLTSALAAQTPDGISVRETVIQYLNPKTQRMERGIPNFISIENRLVLRNGVQLAQKFERL